MESLVTMKSRVAVEAVSVETVASMETMAPVAASMATTAHCIARRVPSEKECNSQEGDYYSSHCQLR